MSLTTLLRVRWLMRSFTMPPTLICLRIALHGASQQALGLQASGYRGAVWETRQNWIGKRTTGPHFLGLLIFEALESFTNTAYRREGLRLTRPWRTSRKSSLISPNFISKRPSPMGM